MQQTASAQKPMVLAALLVSFALALAALVLAPSAAEAKSYTMPQVDIDATVMPNGDLHVVEKRRFTFSGSYSKMQWYFEPSAVDKGDRHGYSVNSVKIKLGDGENQAVSSVPFQKEWRDSDGPSTTAWSYDRKKTTLYLFFDAADTDMTATIDYTVKQAALAFEDVGEIYWKYVGSGWDADSQNVTCTLQLPVPLNDKASESDRLRAWGHGPTDGSVSIAADGTVLYRVNRIAAGHYGEARVVFPVEWLTKLSSSAKRAHGDELGLESVIQDEQNWADASGAQRVAGLLFIAVFIVISLLLLAWTVITFLRHGREPKPTFTDEYWHEVPDEHLHPAVVGRCWRFRKESADDLTATLMHLSAIGAVAINRTADGKPEKDAADEAQSGDLYLTRIPQQAEKLTDELDRDALALVFDTAAGGADSIRLSEFRAYVKEHPETLSERIEAWQDKLTERTEQADIFDPKGEHRRTVTNVAAGIYAVAGIAICTVAMNFAPLAAVLPTCLVMIVFARFMDRRTQKGADLQARSQALCRWLCDFAHAGAGDQLPADAKAWGELLAYAYLFGISNEVVEQLRREMPQLFDEDAIDVEGRSYTPLSWYVRKTDAAASTVGDIFGAAVSSAVEAR